MTVYEASNQAASNAFAAVQQYLNLVKPPGLSMGEKIQVLLDSSQKYLAFEDGRHKNYYYVLFAKIVSDSNCLHYYLFYD